MNLGKCSIDGICGNCTMNAIKSFQRNNGVLDDGIVGSKTKDILFSKNLWNFLPDNWKFWNSSWGYDLLISVRSIFKNDDENELLNRSNNIIQKVFNLLRIELKITELQKRILFEYWPI